MSVAGFDMDLFGTVANDVSAAASTSLMAEPLSPDQFDEQMLAAQPALVRLMHEAVPADLDEEQAAARLVQTFDRFTSLAKIKYLAKLFEKLETEDPSVEMAVFSQTQVLSFELAGHNIEISMEHGKDLSMLTSIRLDGKAFVSANDEFALKAMKQDESFVAVFPTLFDRTIARERVGDEDPIEL